MSTSARQTISYLGKRFAEAGIRLKTRHGQNFLIDLNLLQMIADTAQLTPHDVALEVGAGTGGLTALLAQAAAQVVSVEIDPELYQLASEELDAFENIILLQQDALAGKNELDPHLVATVQQQLAAAPNRRLKLVANLPYSVATPVVSNLLSSAIVPHSMTITIQKELADRFVARPGTSDYSALSVWIQSQCRVSLVRTLPPGVFWPRPKVHSAIVHLEVVPALRANIPDLEFYHTWVRSLFLHRRKFIRGGLASAWKHKLEKPAIDALLAQHQLGPETRAEQLDWPTILALGESARAELNRNSERGTEG